jgi:ubiquinone/menaquinone biosynthesis C-methylase UbiE
MPTKLAALPAYRLWSETWESDPSAIVALESRWAVPWLADLQGKTVVDISCGVGRWLAYAQAQGATVFGTDLCQEMLVQASNKPGIAGRLALADSTRLPLASGIADVALCALSLGHMTPIEPAIAELARIVKPGGCLMVTDFHPDALGRGWRRTFRSNGQLYEVETYPYTKERLIECAHDNGLELQNLLEPCFGEPERPLFLQAGKPELFDQVRGIPAVLLARWTRP